MMVIKQQKYSISNSLDEECQKMRDITAAAQSSEHTIKVSQQPTSSKTIHNNFLTDNVHTQSTKVLNTKVLHTNDPKLTSTDIINNAPSDTQSMVLMKTNETIDGTNTLDLIAHLKHSNNNNNNNNATTTYSSSISASTDEICGDTGNDDKENTMVLKKGNYGDIEDRNTSKEDALSLKHMKIDQIHKVKWFFGKEAFKKMQTFVKNVNSSMNIKRNQLKHRPNHISHQLSIQWTWNNVIKTTNNSSLLENAFNDHCMHSFELPQLQCKYQLQLSNQMQNMKKLNRSESDNTYDVSSNNTKFCDNFDENNSLENIIPIINSDEAIFKRNQNLAIGDTFFHFLRLLHENQSKVESDDTVVYSRYIGYLYNLHRVHLSSQPTGHEFRTQSFDRKWQVLTNNPKQTISLTEYRLFIEHIMQILETKISEFSDCDYKNGYRHGSQWNTKDPNILYLKSVRYQLEKICLMFLNEMPLPLVKSNDFGDTSRTRWSKIKTNLRNQRLSHISAVNWKRRLHSLGSGSISSNSYSSSDIAIEGN